MDWIAVLGCSVLRCALPCYIPEKKTLVPCPSSLSLPSLLVVTKICATIHERCMCIGGQLQIAALQAWSTQCITKPAYKIMDETIQTTEMAVPDILVESSRLGSPISEGGALNNNSNGNAGSPGSPSPRRQRVAPPPPPAHLSEFMSFVNGNGNGNGKGNGSNNNNNSEDKRGAKADITKDVVKGGAGRHGKTKKSIGTPWSIKSGLSGSSDLSDISGLSGISVSGLSIPHSTMELDKSQIVGDKEAEESIGRFAELESVCLELGDALEHVSNVYGKLGAIVEQIARRRGSGIHGEALGSLASYEYMVSAQQRYLGEVFRREVAPEVTAVKKEYTIKWREEQQAFNKEYKRVAKELKETEKTDAKLRRSRIRSLVNYRQSLETLAEKVAQVDQTCCTHYMSAAGLLESANAVICDKLNSAVDTQGTMYNRLAEKVKVVVQLHEEHEEEVRDENENDQNDENDNENDNDNDNATHNGSEDDDTFRADDDDGDGDGDANPQLDPVQDTGEAEDALPAVTADTDGDVLM